MGIETDQGTRVGLPKHRSTVQRVEAFLRAGDPLNTAVQRTWRRARALATILNNLLLDLEVACERIAAAKEPDPQMSIDEAISHAGTHDPTLNRGDRDYLRERLSSADGEPTGSRPAGGSGTTPAPAAEPVVITREMALAELQRAQPERNWSLGAMGQWEQGEIDAAYWWALNSETVPTPVPDHVAQSFFEELDLDLTADVAKLLGWPGIEIEIPPVAIDDWSDELFEEVVIWASRLHLRQRGEPVEVPFMPAIFAPGEGDFEAVLRVVNDESPRGITRLAVLNTLFESIPAVAMAFDALFELDHIERVGHSDLFRFKAAIEDEASFALLGQVVANLGRGLPALEGVDFQKIGDQSGETGEDDLPFESEVFLAGGEINELREQLDDLEEAGPLDLEDQLDLALATVDQEQAEE